MKLLFSLPIPVLFATTMIACLLVNVGKKEYSKNYSNTQVGFFCFNAVYGLVCAICIWALSGFFVQASGYTIILGIVFGLVTMGAMMFCLYALTLGSWAYTTVICSLSTIIPMLSGVMFWNERIARVQIIGMILMLASIVLSVKQDKRESEDKKGGWKWLIFAFVSSVCTGLIGVLQKVHQTSAYKNEAASFLLISFAILCCGSFTTILLFKIKNKKQKLFSFVGNTKAWKLKFLILTILTGICVALNNIINLHLSGVVDSAIFFPIVNGGNLTLTTLLATVLYKEKMTKLQYVGLFCGIIAVIFLCIK